MPDIHQRFGRWCCVKELGEGGQGTVYLAFDSGDSAQTKSFAPERFLEQLIDRATPKVRLASDRSEFDLVAGLVSLFIPNSLRWGALKHIRRDPNARDLENSEHRFRRELDAASKLKHPNLLTLIDSDASSGWHVSEFHSAGSLDSSHSVSTDHVSLLRRFRGLVDGVAALHENQLVHRDIKPQNIFVGDDGRLILGDFGLIRTVDGRTQLTADFQKVGTLAWMPPWAVPFIEGEPTPAFDVYTLGKVLWYLFTGDLHLHHEFGDRTLPSIQDKRLERSVCRLLRKCVVLRSRECMPDASTMLEAVDELIAVATKDEVTRIVSHVLSRPGTLFHLSISGASVNSARKERLICEPKPQSWLVSDDGRDPLRGDVVADLPASMFALDAAKARWELVSPPEFGSRSVIDINIDPIPRSHVQYAQLSLTIEPASRFILYFRFSDDRWLAFDPSATTPRKVNPNEYVVPLEEIPNVPETPVTVSLRGAWKVTWGLEDLELPLITGVRIRGSFRMALLRLI